MRVFQMQRVSAVFLLFFLTLHMVVVHYPPGHIDFSRIAERLANPVWKAIDIVFLFFVLVHALSGTYAVLLDSDKVTGAKRPLAYAAVVIGLIAFVYGSATVMSFNPELATAVR